MNSDSKHPSGTAEPAACREDFFKEIEIEFLIHELKDPISIVETGAQMLLKKQERFGPLTDRQAKTVNRIVRNAAKARQMLYSLLEVGKAEAGSFSCDQFNPALAGFEVLLECLDLQAPDMVDKVRNARQKEAALELLEKSGILFTTDAESVNPMYQDETKFRQIACNLIKNALHYRSEILKIRLQVKNENLVMDVIDDGPGIPEKHHEAIFKRYTQAAECRLNIRNGHGLGLAGARTLARSLGGDIRVSSRENEGAAFRLLMPLRFTDTAKN